MTIWTRLRAAIEADPSIVRESGQVVPHSGFRQDYLMSLGLLKSDLKKLERGGMAVRQYSKNIWVPGETLPNGSTVEDGKWAKGPGHRVLWNILKEKRQ
jgi:hypothetical protein